MLPDFRQLVAMTSLALSVLIFAFGTAALLRSAHDDFTGLQSQRAGREPGRMQFVLDHGAAPALKISDATAVSREAASFLEQNLAALQLPETDASEREPTNIAHATPANASTPAQDAPVQAAVSIPPSSSTLTITDRAAAPAELPPAAAISERARNYAKDEIALNETPVHQTSANTPSLAASDADAALSSKEIQNSDKSQTPPETHVKDDGPQTQLAALDPVTSLRSQPLKPTQRATIRRAKKPNARAAQMRKRILAARQRAAQAAHLASQQTVSSAPLANPLMHGGH